MLLMCKTALISWQNKGSVVENILGSALTTIFCLETYASQTQFKSQPVQQEPAEIRTVNGQAECIRLIDQLGYKQPAMFPYNYSL